MAPRVLTSGSPRREGRYPQPVPADLRPRHVPTRPLTGLAVLLGVKTSGPAGPGPAPVQDTGRGVTGITHDSRLVRPGDLYAALPGSRHHGARFCADAASAGAVAVLTDPAGRDRAIASGLPVFVVGDPRSRLGAVASWVYGNPSARLLLIGVTGTSGKTTTTYLLESGLRAAGHSTGLVGGGETRIGGAGGLRRAGAGGGGPGAAGAGGGSQPPPPGPPALQAFFAVMAARGVPAAA